MCDRVNVPNVPLSGLLASKYWQGRRSGGLSGEVRPALTKQVNLTSIELTSIGVGFPSHLELLRGTSYYGYKITCTAQDRVSESKPAGNAKCKQEKDVTAE